MLNKHTENRDQYSLSRGGMTTVAGYSIVPAVSYDRLRQVNSEQSETGQGGKRRTRRFFRMRRRQPV